RAEVFEVVRLPLDPRAAAGGRLGVRVAARTRGDARGQELHERAGVVRGYAPVHVDARPRARIVPRWRVLVAGRGVRRKRLHDGRAVERIEVAHGHQELEVGNGVDRAAALVVRVRQWNRYPARLAEVVGEDLDVEGGLADAHSAAEIRALGSGIADPARVAEETREADAAVVLARRVPRLDEAHRQLTGAAVRRGVLAGEGIGVRERGRLKTVALDDVLVEVGRTLEGAPRPPEIVVGVGVEEAADETGGLEQHLAALARRAPLAARLWLLDLVRLGVTLLPVARVPVGDRREAARIRREVLVDARIGIGAHRLALGGVDRLRARR